MKVEDNFLDQKVFDGLQALIVDGDFDWYYNPYVVYETPPDNEFQFTHVFYRHNSPLSLHFKILKPILEIINPVILYRIKANLRTRTPNILESEFHVDIDDNLIAEDVKIKQWWTAILYMNTNNGYTEFEDGTKVESIANRMVTFPANLIHRGTSCSDEKIRIVINFNYIK